MYDEDDYIDLWIVVISYSLAGGMLLLLTTIRPLKVEKVDTIILEKFKLLLHLLYFKILNVFSSLAIDQLESKCFVFRQ